MRPEVKKTARNEKDRRERQPFETCEYVRRYVCRYVCRYVAATCAATCAA